MRAEKVRRRCSLRSFTRSTNCLRFDEQIFGMLVTADSKSNRGAHVHLPRRIRLNEGYAARQSDTSFGIGKDHRIPLAELQSVSPKQVNELDSYQGLGWGAAAMGEKGFGNSRVSKRGRYSGIVYVTFLYMGFNARLSTHQKHPISC